MLHLVDKTGPPGSANAQAVDGMASVIGHFVAKYLFEEGIENQTGIEHRLPENVSKAHDTVTMRLGLSEEDSVEQLCKQFIVQMKLQACGSFLGNFYVNASVPGLATDKEAFCSVVIQLLRNNDRYCQSLADEIEDNLGQEATIVDSLSSLKCDFEYYSGVMTSGKIRFAA